MLHEGAFVRESGHDKAGIASLVGMFALADEMAFAPPTLRTRDDAAEDTLLLPSLLEEPFGLFEITFTLGQQDYIAGHDDDLVDTMAVTKGPNPGKSRCRRK